MNASLTFDSAAAIASVVATTQSAAGTLATAFPATRKADVCRVLAEHLKNNEKAVRNGVSAVVTHTKAFEGLINFTTLELQSLKAFWQLAVAADAAVNTKRK